MINNVSVTRGVYGKSSVGKANEALARQMTQAPKADNSTLLKANTDGFGLKEGLCFKGVGRGKNGLYARLSPAGWK